ncbi:phospho-sugar mutase [Peptoniphilus sp. KCTC 25270]|uniref:phospho-sugar mutase n=1 Tax=Peptoniphilus sp. KCTC 25270 TaxID=2897414 RepID=UPI001E4D7ABC|nr:phospho-sugar mutase [Peptoniphilus sp. KCTC 25270]MCD1147229.1 phospho-sugar mutase [Peptoniphilus sp. KCTC 25270]
MIAEKNFKEWMSYENLTEEERKALEGLSEEEREEHFYQELSFGTAGLRGMLGVGTNRMNERVIARATLGLANTIASHGQEAMDKGVAIAWDVRIKSYEFMKIAAAVLASQGIQVHIFEGIRPTPMLSYAVRDLGTQAGIVITASHNPQAYNGYKVYWEEGSQILDDIADEISKEINALSYEKMDFGSFEEFKKQGKIHVIEKELEDRYYEKTVGMSVEEDVDKNISVVYTPLNGTGNEPVRKVLEMEGFTNIHVVPEQENPDGTFKTVGYPNPEDVKAFDYALEDAKELDADLILATDPDCDRVAIMGRVEKGNYYAFNGNQIGALMIYYILSRRHAKGDLPENGAMVKSIVTGELGTAIGKSYDVEMFSTLTGFKNICSLPNRWDETKEYEFIFGYEESIGYTYGDHVRDKDAVVSSMILIEMAAYYKKQGKSVYDVMEEIYEKYGFYKERLLSVVKEGMDGQKQIEEIMISLREEPIVEVDGLKVVKTLDYLEKQGDVGTSNVLEYHLEDGSRFSIRPSGTEPKIKLYIYSIDKVEEEADKKLEKIEAVATERFNRK